MSIGPLTSIKDIAPHLVCWRRSFVLFRKRIRRMLPLHAVLLFIYLQEMVPPLVSGDDDRKTESPWYRDRCCSASDTCGWLCGSSGPVVHKASDKPTCCIQLFQRCPHHLCQHSYCVSPITFYKVIHFVDVFYGDYRVWLAWSRIIT